jgi:flagellar protein FlaF
MGAMPLKLSSKPQVAIEDPRVTEYRLFGQVTGALLHAKQANAVGAPLVEAVDRNLRLWRTLAANCLDDRNTLTQEARAKIISQSLWVAKYSRSVTREKAPLDPLIEINRTIMQGLQAG